MNEPAAKQDLLITLCDANFIPQAKQLFASAYFKAGWPGDCLLLAQDLPAEERRWFEERGIIVFSPPPLAAAPLGDRAYPPIILSKLYFFTPYFKRWRKLVFLDADIIINCSLDGLLRYGGFSAPYAATLQLRDEFLSLPEQGASEKKYDWDSRPFSAGVMVIETDLIKDETFGELQALYHRFRGCYRFGEESVLNLYLYQRWQEISLAYNSTPWYLDSYYKLPDRRSLAVIRHFVGRPKPWEDSSPYLAAWRANLALADQVDFKLAPADRPVGVPGPSARQIRRYDNFLQRRRCLYFFYNLRYTVDRQLGKIGRLIRSRNEGLYKCLVKFKKIF